MVKETLKSHVENKIFKGYMIISKLSTDEFKYIDEFCKYNFENNRRLMVLALIKHYEDNVAVNLLDDKLALVYESINTRLENLEQGNITKEPIKKNTWKGFKQND